jgi:hypothetical protein
MWPFSAIRGPLRPAFYPNENATVIVNCLENLFTSHNVCDTDHERRVEARVQALLTIVDEKHSVKFRPCDVSKDIRSLKLGKACGIDNIPNAYLRYLPRRSLVDITHLFSHCLRLYHFPASWKEVKIISLLKSGKITNFPQNLRPISLLSTKGKLFEKLILRIIHRQIEERNLPNASQFNFHARHSTTLRCMRLMDHVSLNFNNNMSTAAIFLFIELTFDRTWHPGLLVTETEREQDVLLSFQSYIIFGE